MRPVLFRLRTVQPECIPALREELAGKVVPVEVARRGIGGVIHVCVGNIEMIRHHGGEIFCCRIEKSPDRKHRVDVLVMQSL